MVLLVLLLCGLASLLQGCGGGGDTSAPTSAPTVPPTALPTTATTTAATPTPPPTPRPTAPAPTGAYTCQSDLMINASSLRNMSQKGLAVDDDTLFGCTDKIPETWPNTAEPIQYFRLFKASRPTDSDKKAADVRAAFVAHVKRHKVKVLVGTQISCEPDEDEADWQRVKRLLKDLGRDHVLGLAVGNEIDQLPHHSDVNQSCLDYIWDGYLINQTYRMAKEARDIVGEPNLPVTSVFTGEVIWSGADTKRLRVREYFKNVLGGGHLPALNSFVFTMNYYPYFDPSNKMDADGKHCHAAVAKSKCFDSASCLTILNIVQTRTYLQAFNGTENARLWIGELGWSSPKPDGFASPVAECDEFDGYPMLYDYYRNYLAWDLTHPGGLEPEVVFYFTMRDSNNFGHPEHFGLIETCKDSACKLTQDRVKTNSTERTSRSSMVVV